MAGLLLFGDTVRFAALRHEIPAEIIDDLLFAEIDGKRFVLTWTFERDRVRQARPDVEVLDFLSFGYRDLVKDGTSLLERGGSRRPALWGQLGRCARLVPRASCPARPGGAPVHAHRAPARSGRRRAAGRELALGEFVLGEFVRRGLAGEGLVLRELAGRGLARGRLALWELARAGRGDRRVARSRLRTR